MKGHARRRHRRQGCAEYAPAVLGLLLRQGGHSPSVVAQPFSWAGDEVWQFIFDRGEVSVTTVLENAGVLMVSWSKGRPTEQSREKRREKRGGVGSVRGEAWLTWPNVTLFCIPNFKFRFFGKGCQIIHARRRLEGWTPVPLLLCYW